MHTFILETVHSFALSGHHTAVMPWRYSSHTHTHIQTHTWFPLPLTVIAIPFTPQLLSLWESNMKWLNSVIKTGNEIRVCD